MTLLCPACNAVLPIAKEGEQVCSICGKKASASAVASVAAPEVDETVASLSEEAERESDKIASRYQHRIPTHLMALARDFHFRLGVHSSPEPTRQQVVTIVGLLFPDCTATVMKMLDRFGADQASGRERVQLAVLKLAGSEVAQISKYVDDAIEDIREVVMPAEAPRASAIILSQGFAAAQALQQDELVELAESDLLQYLQWLESVVSEKKIQ